MGQSAAVLMDNPDLHDLILPFLRGVDAYRLLRLANSSLSAAMAPTRDWVWSGFLQQEYNCCDHSRQGSKPPETPFLRYCQLSMRARSMLWRAQPKSASDPPARQGSSGCALSLAGGSFALFGGWTVRGMARDLHVFHKNPCHVPAGTASEAQIDSYVWSKLNLTREPGAVATYGHSLTAIPYKRHGIVEDGIETERLMVFGGVTMGGYRGAVGEVHIVELDYSEKVLSFRASWLDNANIGEGLPR